MTLFAPAGVDFRRCLQTCSSRPHLSQLSPSPRDRRQPPDQRWSGFGDEFAIKHRRQLSPSGYITTAIAQSFSSRRDSVTPNPPTATERTETKTLHWTSCITSSRPALTACQRDQAKRLAAISESRQDFINLQTLLHGDTGVFLSFHVIRTWSEGGEACWLSAHFTATSAAACGVY
jgi:hypothetical protein